MNGAKSFIADDGGVNNDEGSVRVDESFKKKFADGLLNDRFAFGAFEGKTAGTNAVVQGELAGEAGREGKSVDGGDTGPEGGGDAGHATRSGKEKDSLGPELVGEMDAGGDDPIGLPVGVDLFLVADGAGALDAAGDAVEHLEASAGIFARSGFARKHNGVGPFEDGVGDVGDFGASGERVGDHALEHMGGDDDGFHRGDALLDDSPLNNGEFLVGAFDAEIAASDHDGIGGGDDAEDIFDGELVFDLGDDFHLGAAVLVEEIAEGDDILRITDKGERDPIDPCFQADEEIGRIFFGDGGEVDADAGKIDVAAIAEGTGGEDAAEKGGGVFSDHLEVNDAVIDEEFLAGCEIVNEVGIVDGDGGGRSLGVDREDEFVSDGEWAGLANGAGSDGGALGVEEEGDLLASAGGEGAEHRSHRANKVVGGVGHIEPKNFGPGIDELGEGGGVGVLWAESGDEFGAAGVG